MLLFASTIGLSAFLLFLVQPIIAKQILPWFGGTSAVWTTCMVFFQVLLLAGYAYAHFTTARLSARAQARLHIGLLLVSLAFLPIIPSEALKPAGDEDAALAIIVLLAITIGLPYFLLSATGPLLQKWVAPRLPHTTVYRLFALSNFGSLIGLLAFPFAIEPFASSTMQSWVWSIGYAAFALTCAACAWQASATTGTVSGLAATSATAADIGPPPSAAHYTMWLSLSALGSILLLAATSHITQNIASVPFLWVLPLTLYLLTFVIVFEGRGGRGWYEPRVWMLPALSLTVLMAAALKAGNGVLDVGLAVPLYCAGMFVACVFCHGELALRKPTPRYLTHFYLALAAGGAAGGLIVGLVAPRVFPTYYELPLVLFAVAAIGALTAWGNHRLDPAWKISLAGTALAATAATAYYGFDYATFLHNDAIVMQRNFYGTLRVKTSGTGELEVRRLLHGVILHGEQNLHGPLVLEPGTYYPRSSGVGLAIEAKQAGGAVRLGVVGLGVGTTAAYGRAGDTVRFYELDADVKALAHSQFTFLTSSPARIEFALGDARLSLERELARGQAQRFDVLAIDAFSSDSIPVHLITREAVRLYMRHLAPGGIVAIHISNRFLDLKPVLANIALAEGLVARIVSDSPSEESGASSSDWVLLAATEAEFKPEALASRIETIAPNPAFSLWTDQFNNLIDVLKIRPLDSLRSAVGLD